jgi:alkylhydroperoxidase/carboxymuconolactone decarboxylase family protein YurZ
VTSCSSMPAMRRAARVALEVYCEFCGILFPLG